MRAIHAGLLALALSAVAQSAPAPLPKRHVPAPETVLARLRAEGFDVSGLTHQSGSRWVSETAVDVSGSALPPSAFVVKRTIVAPGDPTDKLREALMKKW